MAKEMLHHPDHYQGKGGLEVWQVQEAFTSELSGVIAGDACALIKYACRWPKKNGVEDLKKIIEYANHLIEKLEEGDVKSEFLETKNTREVDITLHRMQAIVDELRFGDTDSAKKIVQDLKEILDKYGEVRVIDVLDLLDVRAPYDHGVEQYGWINLDGIYAFKYLHEQDKPSRIQFPPIIKLYKAKESN